MSLIPLPIRGFIAATGLCLVAFSARTVVRADEPGDPLKVNTFWKGECVYEKSDYFPESKPVGEKGEITLLEEEVIHGGASAERPTGVQAGMKWVGKLDKTTIKGTGKWTGPAFNGEIRARFSLKLAE
jgi:hypothetical protein